LIDPALTPEQAVSRTRRPGRPTIFFDGRGGHGNAWPTRVAIDPTPMSSDLGAIDRAARDRRERGGPGGTGIAVVLAYELFAKRSDPDLPRCASFAVDSSIEFPEGGTPRVIGPLDPADRLQHPAKPASGFSSHPLRTSLPKARYLEAVRQVQRHIAEGDVYQANLTQRLSCDFDGDAWALYRGLTESTHAPRSAFVDAGAWALASVSPETFVDVTKDNIATTLPIKGTRPRGETPEEDEAMKRDLLASEKDRAELTMIVDLERNDLGRIAKTGTVHVPELATLKTYPAVHHLVATVTATLKEGTGFEDLVRAVFPGGSITGAPKRRAVEVLETLEPVPRGFYTGSLFFLDDDGSTWSSILIRSVVVARGVAHLGAGGGVVADSDPEGEWMESNAKARALTRVLGFEPEEAE
jgi:anthranilate/para-aminobenzoate synthase component I